MRSTFIARDQGAVHFVTFTVHQWVDVFSRSIYIEELINDLRFCQKNKGLEIYAWVVMTNHCHFILRASHKNLSDIIRDLKKFTAKKLYKMIEANSFESRKEWLLITLKYEGRIWFWEAGYHGMEISANKAYDNIADYIHMNPVKAGMVQKPTHYRWSSAADYEGIGENLLPLQRYE